VINPIINKVAKFERIAARRIVGQSLSTLNIRQMIKDQKIILLKLSRSVVGSDVAALIGATVLGLIQVTLEEAGQQAKNAYNNLPIILDEFQMLAGADYRTLVELQKYGVTFFLATQSLEYLQKLNPVLLPTVLTNTKQSVSFNMTAQDAELICREIEVRPEDLLHLDTQSCYISLVAAQQRQPTFSVKVSPLPEGDTTVAESIRTRCRIRYTRPIEEVDDMLRDALLRSIRINAPTQEREREQENLPSPTWVSPVEERNTRTVSSSLEPERSGERIPQNEERQEYHYSEEGRLRSKKHSAAYEAGGSEEHAESQFNEELEYSEQKEELELIDLKMLNRNEEDEDDEEDEGNDYHEFGNHKQQGSDGKSVNNRASRQQEYLRRLQQNQ
jgi:hypothetical protein